MNISKLEEKRNKTKGDVWDVNIKNTTASVHIRKHAHQEMKFHNIKKKCVVTGRTAGLDLAHVIACSSFNNSDNLGEINHIGNLVFLSKEIHCRFDYVVRNMKTQTIGLDDLNTQLVILKALNDQCSVYKIIDSTFKNPLNISSMISAVTSKISSGDFILGKTPHKRAKLNYKTSKLVRRRRMTLGAAKKLSQRSNGTHYSIVREHARMEAHFHGFDECCLVTGDNSYIECSHIFPISLFPDNTPLGVINHPHNLMYLTPYLNRVFDNPKLFPQLEYNNLMNALNEKLPIHREKHPLDTLSSESLIYYTFNTASPMLWKECNTELAVMAGRFFE